MGDKKKGWSLDVPKDPKKVASYSSTYTGTMQGDYMSKEVFEKSLKKVSRKIKPVEAPKGK